MEYYYSRVSAQKRDIEINKKALKVYCIISTFKTAEWTFIWPAVYFERHYEHIKNTHQSSVQKNFIFCKFLRLIFQSLNTGINVI